MSLVDTLGLHYCNDFLRGALVAHQGKAYIIERIGEEEVHLSSRGPHRSWAVPTETFLRGFAALAYPELGYRKVNGHAIHVQRTSSSRRGLHPSCLFLTATPVTGTIMTLRSDNSFVAHGNADVQKQVICPEYDSLSVLDDLVAGTALCWVPNNDVCIEPALTGNSFVVYWRDKAVGTMSQDKTLNIRSSAVRSVINKLMGN